MTYEQFLLIVTNYQRYNEIISEAYDIGLDLLEGKFSTVYNVASIFKNAVTSHYTDEGWDWIEWFIYENEYGEKGLEAYDAEKNLIFQSCKDAYEELEKNYKRTDK